MPVALRNALFGYTRCRINGEKVGQLYVYIHNLKQTIDQKWNINFVFEIRRQAVRQNQCQMKLELWFKLIVYIDEDQTSGFRFIDYG